ncbi:hypothetical protein JCM21714_902 [Gracilibacillus boraciitolerans JCM 21714]|uniref:SGNH hydrolase-type esterase domain-containing protein n=1 Tax=Gracilibacillus boraciitolerans JCM 21714 TaxID=1298598 RepID=W4VFK4_9BACI|nr:hypothetical protein JCM21714_902 [Gracilibacillus boraciitolerans JCM 21714]
MGRFEDQEGIGSGYVRFLHDYLRVTNPNKNYEIFNRGIGGDRVTNLEERWQEDVIDLHPEVVSVSIGINDVWRQLDRPDMDQVTPDVFEDKLRKLLYEIRDKQIILMEPTVIEEDLNSEGNRRLREYVEIVRKLSLEFQTVLVPTHQVFLDYIKEDSGYALTTDGVHMNSAGNLLMAKTWIKAVEKQS